MEIEAAANGKTSENFQDVSIPESSTSAAPSTISIEPGLKSSEIAAQTSTCTSITEEHVSVRRDFPIFTNSTTILQQPEVVSAKMNTHVADADGEDARSTSSSHPFSSPNPSEQDDVHSGADASMIHFDSRKVYRRRKHEATASTSTGVSGNRPPFPLSERQQMALAMQLSAQNKSGDHPKSPSSSVATTPQGSGGRSRGKLAKVHRKNERGETPLHLAAKRGEFQRCTELIDDGADVNCADYADWTPLHEACNKGWYKTAKVLVEHGANVNVCGLDDDTPLHDAALNGHQELVILLLQHGADPCKYNKHGKRPIDVAEDPEVIRLMLEVPLKSSSPFSTYSVDSPANEESDRVKTPQNSERTLTADEIGTDASAANSSLLFASDAAITNISVLREDPAGLNDSIESAVSEPPADRLEKGASMANNDGNTEERTAGRSGAVDCSSHTAYASTESENEQRLVVVEEECLNSEKTLPAVKESPKTSETSSTIRQLESTTESHQPPIATKPAEDTRAVRPKRHIAYMRQRRLEQEFGVTATAKPVGRPPGSGVRGRKRKTMAAGPRAKDVYEFHSSDSDDEADSVGAAGKLRKKFAKVGTGIKQAVGVATSTTVSSGAQDVAAQKEKAAEAETRAMVEKIKMEVERKEEEREKNAVAAVVDVVSIIPADPMVNSNSEVVTQEDQDVSSASKAVILSDSKEDVQPMETTNLDVQNSNGGETNNSALGSVIAEAAVSDKILTSTAIPSISGTGSKKERLLGFGRRRGFMVDHKTQKEREAHIANVVASIGSGVAAPKAADADQDAAAATTDLLSEASHGIKKKLILELSRSESKQEATTSGMEPQKPRAAAQGPVGNEEEDSSGGLLKVPPLKLILAGRSNSDEDNSHSASNIRETTGRTYVVRSRANSPASERRGSIAADLSDQAISATTILQKPEDGRRMGVGNAGAGVAVTQGNGNGNGNGSEASQRVTRSQVRLHGAQLDRAAEDPLAMAIHPRKRKMRSAKTLIEPVVVDRPLVPVVSPSLAAIAVKNSYEAHQHMKKAIANKWKNDLDNLSRAATANQVKGFEHFLIRNKNYLLHGGNNGYKPPEEVKESLPPVLAELKRQQAIERQSMERQHRMERERLIMACEIEAIRDHNRCIRGTADPPISVMRVLRDADLYNPLQLDKDVPFSLAASATRDCPTDVSSRFDKPKRQMIGRQRLEAQCLHASQIQEWEIRLKRLLLPASDVASSTDINVPQLIVVHDFSLLPSH